MAYFIKSDLENIYKSYCKDENDNIIFVSFQDNGITIFAEKEDLNQPIFRHKATEINFEISHPDELNHILLNLQTLYEGRVTLKVGNSRLSAAATSEKRDFFLNYLSLWLGNELFIPEDKTDEIDIKITISEFFLCVIEDLFDPSSDFNTYSRDFCSTYRTIFLNSTIFNYIYKKRNFYKALYDYKEAGCPLDNSNHYKFQIKKNYDEYLELLLKDEILKYVPYEKLKKDYYWFLHNPEDEIYKLGDIEKDFLKKGIFMTRNISIKSRFDSTSASEYIDNYKDLNNKIVNYLLGKHDIFRAVKVFSHDYILLLISLIQLTIALTLTYMICHFWKSEEIVITIPFALKIIIYPFIFIFIIFLFKNYNLLLLRLVLSITTFWLIVVNLKDFTPTMIGISNTKLIIFISFLVLLIFVSIASEIKSHSKYFRILTLNSIMKSIAIFIFAFNNSMIIGFFFHSQVTVDFVEKNNIIPPIFYNNHNEDKNSIYYITKLYESLKSHHPDSIVSSFFINELFSQDSCAFIHINSKFINPIHIDTTSFAQMQKILMKNKDTAVILRIFGHPFIIYFRMFLIQGFMVMAFSIIAQSLLSKETITEPI